jgi:hypothetical protein
MINYILSIYLFIAAICFNLYYGSKFIRDEIISRTKKYEEKNNISYSEGQIRSIYYNTLFLAALFWPFTISSILPKND